jgi:hypothetical protein
MLYLFRRSLIAIILFIASFSSVFAATELRDEGISQGYINILNFTGAGVTASRSGIIGTIAIPGGGGGASNYTNFTTDEVTNISWPHTFNATQLQVNGVNVITSLTPWTSNIVGAGYNVTNVTRFGLGGGSEDQGLESGAVEGGVWDAWDLLLRYHDEFIIYDNRQKIARVLIEKDTGNVTIANNLTVNGTINAAGGNSSYWNDKGTSNLTMAQVLALNNLTNYINASSFNESAQDTIGGALAPTASIVPTYTDASNQITWAINTSWVVPAAQLSSGSALQSISGGNVTPDDFLPHNNTMSFTVTGITNNTDFTFFEVPKAITFTRVALWLSGGTNCTGMLQNCTNATNPTSCGNINSTDWTINNNTGATVITAFNVSAIPAGQFMHWNTTAEVGEGTLSLTTRYNE